MSSIDNDPDQGQEGRSPEDAGAEGGAAPTAGAGADSSPAARASAEALSGLQWLARERPEAMQHLLAFFRESGRHLDPRTRFLISVVTKVVRFSPRGLRQYIPRAMREGASRDEVLDAILCAYPAAGLTHVVDAVQILRSLDLDRLESEAAGSQGPPTAPVWVAVARRDSVPPGTARVVTARGQSLALYHVDGSFHATANACLHQGGELARGQLSGPVVTCPRHGWTFDVTTGQCLTQPGRQVSRFEVRLQGDEVMVLV